MSILFKSIIAASSCSLCLLISISRGTTLVTSLFFIPSVLKNLNEKFISFIYILLSFTSCLLIPVFVHLESTSTFTLRFLLFFVFMFACTFNSPLISLHQFRITYLFWEFTREISHTILTQNLLPNPAFCPSLCCLHYLIPLKSFISSSIAFFCNLLIIYPSLSHLKYFLISFSFFF